MHQATRSQLRRHVESLRHDRARPFDGPLDPDLVAAALAQERVR